MTWKFNEGIKKVDTGRVTEGMGGHVPHRVTGGGIQYTDMATRWPR